jgi:osmotically-inducible protein OsmY
MADTLATFEDRVGSALSGNPHLAGRVLRFEANKGRVVLHGVVTSYYLKQIAQEAVRLVDGVDQIVNQLKVSRPR